MPRKGRAATRPSPFIRRPPRRVQQVVSKAALKAKLGQTAGTRVSPAAVTVVWAWVNNAVDAIAFGAAESLKDENHRRRLVGFPRAKRVLKVHHLGLMAGPLVTKECAPPSAPEDIDATEIA